MIIKSISPDLEMFQPTPHTTSLVLLESSISQNHFEVHDSYSPKWSSLLVTTGIALPLFVSKPYFLSADPSYSSAVQFLNDPEPEDIDSHFYIEPVSFNVIVSLLRRSTQES